MMMIPEAHKAARVGAWVYRVYFATCFFRGPGGRRGRGGLVPHLLPLHKYGCHLPIRDNSRASQRTSREYTISLGPLKEGTVCPPFGGPNPFLDINTPCQRPSEPGESKLGGCGCSRRVLRVPSLRKVPNQAKRRWAGDPRRTTYVYIYIYDDEPRIQEGHREETRPRPPGEQTLPFQGCGDLV